MQMGVWNESIANGDLMSGSFVGLRPALMPRACTTRKSSAQSNNILMRLLRVELWLASSRKSIAVTGRSMLGE